MNPHSKLSDCKRPAAAWKWRRSDRDFPNHSSSSGIPCESVPFQQVQCLNPALEKWYYFPIQTAQNIQMKIPRRLISHGFGSAWLGVGCVYFPE